MKVYMAKFKEWLSKTWMGNYFVSEVYKKHGFLLLGFNKKDYATFQMLSASKKKSRSTWFENNLGWPLFVIFLPWGFALLHRGFNTVAYDKTLLDIAISGSLTLVGINVLRSTFILISDRLDDTKIPEELKDGWPEVLGEIKGMKEKIKWKVWFFSVVGTVLYVIQVTQMVNATVSYIYYILLGIVYIAIVSIFLARFIFLLETNFLEDRDLVEMLFSCLRTQKDDLQKMKTKLAKQGIN